MLCLFVDVTPEKDTSTNCMKAANVFWILLYVFSLSFIMSWRESQKKWRCQAWSVMRCFPCLCLKTSWQSGSGPSPSKCQARKAEKLQEEARSFTISIKNIHFCQTLAVNLIELEKVWDSPCTRWYSLVSMLRQKTTCKTSQNGPAVFPIVEVKVAPKAGRREKADVKKGFVQEYRDLQRRRWSCARGWSYKEVSMTWSAD